MTPMAFLGLATRPERKGPQRIPETDKGKSIRGNEGKFNRFAESLARLDVEGGLGRSCHRDFWHMRVTRQDPKFGSMLGPIPTAIRTKIDQP